MTKEELISHKNSAIYFFPYVEVVPLNLCKEFLELNVCIPKGKNRHDYADELHAYAEGVNVECNRGMGWTRAIFDDGVQYRIESLEPIYEWQWYSVIDGCVDDTTDTWENKKWLTEKEMIVWGNHWRKFEETKRERK